MPVWLRTRSKRSWKRTTGSACSRTRWTPADLEVREAEERDLQSLNELYNHYVRTSPCTFDIEPISMDARREWFAGFGGRYLLFVAADAGAVIGYAHSKS